MVAMEEANDMTDSTPETSLFRDRWAHLRFSIVGPLLAAPPPSRELRAEIERLSRRHWRHPVTGAPVAFGVSTIERWYYAARNEHRDPVGVLKRRVRKDAGTHPSLSPGLREVVRAQHKMHRAGPISSTPTTSPCSPRSNRAPFPRTRRCCGT
jgi:hypothetical protein